MILRSRSLRSIVLAAALWPAASVAAGLNTTQFVPEPSVSLPNGASPAPAGIRGHARPKSARAVKLRGQAASLGDRIGVTDSIAAMVDTYVQDGWESAVAVNPADPNNVVVGFEEGWDFDPDVPLGSLRTGVPGWSPSVFPNGTGIYAGYPGQPWVGAGNAPGEFFASLIRQDLFPTDNTHVILARSADGGSTFTSFYEIQRTVMQDRAMFDIDRPASLGGTTGAFDGKLYLCFDDWGPAGAGYTGSWLEVLNSDGTLSSESQLSGTGTPPFRGTQFQPVAGLADGQFFLVSNSITSGGATVNATFHQFDGGGATRAYSKSTLSWAPAGQKLGASTHWGVNGYRVDERGFLAIDHTFGPRRDFMYFITNRNPNPADPTLDQGDIYLSVSVTRGSSWTTAKIPLQGNKTQFFPMVDVDGQGWIHVAYYQNESGGQNGGVLNAGEVDVYYVVSRDGGYSWTPPVRVNETAHFLNQEDPPLLLSGSDFNLIGDYMQIKAIGLGVQTSAYVVWTGYDQYRADDGVGTKKQRVYATRVTAPAAPGATQGVVAGVAALLAAAGALALYRRRRAY